MQTNTDHTPKKTSLFQNCGVHFLIAHNIKNDMTVPHLHPHYEIYYNIKGGKSYFINGTFIQVAPFDLVLIPKTQIHKAVRDYSLPYDAYVLNFDDIVLQKLTDMPLMYECTDNHSYETDWLNSIDFGCTKPYKVHLNLQQHQYILNLFEECIEAEQSNKILHVLLKFLQIFLFARSLFINTTVNTSEHCIPQKWSEKVMCYVENHLFEDISITEMANTLYVNKSHLAETFKTETSVTINHYITQRRIAEAQKFLYEGFSVKETALKSGYKNPSHFTKSFKQTVGCSPSFFAKHIDNQW